MAAYKLLFKPSVQKDLRAIPEKTVARILRSAEGLAGNPLPRGAVKLEGTEDLHRIRIGDYRLIYSIDEIAKEVLVRYVRHRRDAYRQRRQE